MDTETQGGTLAKGKTDPVDWLSATVNKVTQTAVLECEGETLNVHWGKSKAGIPKTSISHTCLALPK